MNNIFFFRHETPVQQILVGLKQPLDAKYLGLKNKWLNSEGFLFSRRQKLPQESFAQRHFST
jgi:hypothetical protein